MRDEKGFTLGYRGLIATEKMEPHYNHPIYEAYVASPHAEVSTGAILDKWTRLPIMSSSFNVCYPTIALRPGEGQLVHVSNDPVYETNDELYFRRLREWKEEGCDVIQLRTSRSTTMGERRVLQELGSHFFEIQEKGIGSRFQIVVDVQRRILIVQFSDINELREYKI